MAPYYHITVLLIDAEEKALLAKAGVRFADSLAGPRGESVSFDIGEHDPQWDEVNAILAALPGRDGVAKEYRVQRLSMTAPTMEESTQMTADRVAGVHTLTRGLAWLSGYSGQSVEELLSLEESCRADSLVLAFEEAIRLKAQRRGTSLTHEEQVVLAVEAIEREVNNGGYHQFFINSSREFSAIAAKALESIGCSQTAKITGTAIHALGTKDLSSGAIIAAALGANKECLENLSRCDDFYNKSTDRIAEKLLAFIKANKANIRL